MAYDIPDYPFAPFRDDAVVVTRKETLTDGPFGSTSETTDVWTGKGDLQESSKIKRRFATRGSDADAILYLPDEAMALVETGDNVNVDGRDWQLEELLPIDGSVALKARD